MSTIGLRFTPPEASYEGFKFRMAGILCLVFGFFAAVFLAKHTLVLHSDHTVDVLPEPFHVIGSYLLTYYMRTVGGLLELAMMLAGFGAVFWLNLPKQYFASRYRDYGKERVSAEAKSLTLLLTLMALSLVFLSVPFLTLHFPGWLSRLMKYGPIAVGVLQYLSMLPKMEIERAPAIDKLNWDMRGFDATRRSTTNQAVAKELKACASLMSPSNPDAVRLFLRQGSATVTWSGTDAFFRNLESVLGVSAEFMTLHDNTSQALEIALGEVLDARRGRATLVLSTDAEHNSLRSVLKDHLQPTYRFQLETVHVQNLLWNNASMKDIVSTLLNALRENKPQIAVFSHVFPYTGIVLDLKELIDAANKENIPTLFVIDGSQAIGNIMVGDDAFGRSAYYAFHGHGWLLGTPSVGILVRNPLLLRVMAGIGQAASKSDPFSSFRQVDLEEMPPGYDEYSSRFALNYVLKHEWLAVGIENATTHTKKLASLFRDEMHKRDIRTVGISAASPAVVITDIPQIEGLYHALQLKRLDCRIVTADLGNGAVASGIRFCFHHYHGDDDVRDLAELIGNLKAEADSIRPEDAAEPPVPKRSFRQSA